MEEGQGGREGGREGELRLSDSLFSQTPGACLRDFFDMDDSAFHVDHVKIKVRYRSI